jgi:hypothetical protein
MIRIIIYFMKLILALLFALFFSACQFNSGKTVTVSGTSKIENRNLSGFTGISVQRALEVVVEQSDKFEVIVEADDNILSHITTDIRDGILVIETDINNFDNVNKKKIRVKMPNVASLESSSASSIKSKNTLITQDLNIDSSSGSTIEISVEAENLTCDSSSGSTIELKGKALNLNADSSSGSTINAENLLVNDVTANSGSSGSVSVHPIVSLNAEASSGSHILYNIVPKKLVQSSSSGGSVSQK